MKTTLSDLYKEIGDKWGVSPNTVEKIERDFWLQIRLSIAEGEGKQFLVNYLGSFWVPFSKREKYRDRIRDKFHEGLITEEEMNIRLTRLEECQDSTKDTNSQLSKIG